MDATMRPITEITHQAMTLLTREMGVGDTLRFLSQFNTGMGNYTEERDALTCAVSVVTSCSVLSSWRRRSRVGSARCPEHLGRHNAALLIEACR